MTDVVVSLDVAQKVFDIATESMDFGSGFLDDEEVEALRSFAQSIGADVWKATPDNFLDKYCGEHDWRAVGEATLRTVQRFECSRCGKYKYEPVS